MLLQAIASPRVLDDERRQAEWINDAPWNQLWVGLGPWRVVANDAQKIEAVRFEGYFDPERAGFFDRVRWRIVPDAGVLTAMLEGEVDFTARVPTAEFFGEATRSGRFAERFVTGTYYQGRYGALLWNTRRPGLADPRVRRAFAKAFDFEAVLAQEAQRHSAQGVICGHIHHAAMRPVGDIIYINTGDWVESCTAVAETEDGTFEIIRWTSPSHDLSLPEARVEELEAAA